jgi:chromate transport protein ChrA
MREPPPEVRAASAPEGPGYGQAALAWLAFLGPPLFLVTQVFAGYMLAGQSCQHGRWVNHLTVAICFVGAAGCTSLARRDLNAEAARARFLAVAGLISGIVSLLALLAQWVPILGLDPCSRI